MCTHMSHTVFNGNCLCGTIREGIYCAARGRAKADSGPPLFKSEGYTVMTNDLCCMHPENCSKVQYSYEVYRD